MSRPSYAPSNDEIRPSLFFVLILVSLTATAFAGPPVEQFQVNTYTTYYQYEPQAAALADGGFVVVWSSYGSPGPDQSAYSVQARRYASDGAPSGAQFQVNVAGGSSQDFPVAHGAPDGSFLIVWTDPAGVVGRRYAPDGSSIGGEFEIEPSSPQPANRLSLAPSPDGGFLLVWGNTNGLRARRFVSDGTAVGEGFQVHSELTGAVKQPRAAVLSTGEFVVAWDQEYVGGDPSFNVQMRRFASDGAPYGAQFQVNTYTPGYQYAYQVVVLPGDDFLVVWDSAGSPGGDPGGSVQARRYASDATPIGDQFQVNQYTTGIQSSPTAVREQDGGFLIAWKNNPAIAPDDGRSLRAQSFYASGERRGASFQVNSYTTGSHDSRARLIASFDGHQILALWEGRSGSPGDDPDESIQARYLPNFFRDGFESGDLSAWSGGSEAPEDSCAPTSCDGQ